MRSCYPAVLPSPCGATLAGETSGRADVILVAPSGPLVKRPDPFRFARLGAKSGPIEEVTMERSDELRTLFEQWYDAWAKGDADAVTQLVSRSSDALFVGTDPDEWLSGSETIRRVVASWFEEVGSFRFVPEIIDAFRENDVGWVASRATLMAEDGSQLPCRMTAVFRREDGAWKQVQYHGSFGVPNEEVSPDWGAASQRTAQISESKG
jgi:uncharacterized protein (TIGR02246 family)